MVKPPCLNFSVIKVFRYPNILEILRYYCIHCNCLSLILFLDVVLSHCDGVCCSRKNTSKYRITFWKGTVVTITVMILSFRTDRPWQTVQTQIRLLLEEQSDQGLHCLPFRLHPLDSLLYGKAT